MAENYAMELSIPFNTTEELIVRLEELLPSFRRSDAKELREQAKKDFVVVSSNPVDNDAKDDNSTPVDAAGSSGQSPPATVAVAPVASTPTPVSAPAPAADPKEVLADMLRVLKLHYESGNADKRKRLLTARAAMGLKALSDAKLDHIDALRALAAELDAL